MKNRILITLSLVAVLALCLGVVCSASTGAINPAVIDYILPEYIIIYTADDPIYISYGNRFITDDDVVVSFYGMYPYELIATLPSLTAELIAGDQHSEFTAISFVYGSMYWEGDSNDPFDNPIQYWTPDLDDTTDVVVDIEVDYIHYDEQGIIVYDTFTDNYSVAADSVVSVNVPGYARMFSANDGEVTHLAVTLSFDYYISDLCFTFLPMSDVDIVNGSRTPYALEVQRINPDIFSWLSTSVQGFLDTPIYGDNITFGNLLIILISVPLTIAFLKFFAGG